MIEMRFNNDGNTFSIINNEVTLAEDLGQDGTNSGDWYYDIKEILTKLGYEIKETEAK